MKYLEPLRVHVAPLESHLLFALALHHHFPCILCLLSLFLCGSQDRWTNPLMGWPSSEDAQFNQITRMDFETEEEAVHYAKSQGLDFVLMDCPEPSFKPKSYSANFKWKGEPKKK